MTGVAGSRPPGHNDDMPWTTDVIATKRLTLRCPTDRDRPAFKRILTEGEVRQFLGGPVSDATLRWFDSHQLGEQWGMFTAILSRSGHVIGTFSFENERDDTELSYQLLPEFWGHGYALEAAEALLAWGWENLSVDSLIAVTHSLNGRSLSLLERLGFVPDGEFDEEGEPQTRLRVDRPG